MYPQKVEKSRIKPLSRMGRKFFAWCENNFRKIVWGASCGITFRNGSVRLLSKGAYKSSPHPSLVRGKEKGFGFQPKEQRKGKG